MKIGVFVCHCGSNIAGTVDVAKVAKAHLKGAVAMGGSHARLRQLGAAYVAGAS